MKTLIAALAALAALTGTAGQASGQTPAFRSDRLSVQVRGAGPDVVLIPGLASSARVWDVTAARLATTHRVHVVQVAGFAGAAAGANAEGPVLEPVVAELERYVVSQRLSQPAVIGHSMGGEAALMMASRGRAPVSRVMAVDALPFFSLLFSPQTTSDTARPFADRMRDSMLAMSPEAYAASQPAGLARLVMNPAARERHAAASAASDRRVVAQAMHDIMVADLRPALAANTLPITVLYAWDASTGAPVETFDRLWTGAYAGLPNVTLRRIDGSYHFIMDDQPERFAEAVDAFLAAP